MKSAARDPYSVNSAARNPYSVNPIDKIATRPAIIIEGFPFFNAVFLTTREIDR